MNKTRHLTDYDVTTHLLANEKHRAFKTYIASFVLSDARPCFTRKQMCCNSRAFRQRHMFVHQTSKRLHQTYVCLLSSSRHIHATKHMYSALSNTMLSTSVQTFKKQTISSSAPAYTCWERQHCNRFNATRLLSVLISSKALRQNTNCFVWSLVCTQFCCYILI